ncbi:carboxypeptidase-like regulatory domain-containing protein [Aquimarina pacifica]|uniref:carboxypeptidase-like regulatory domain-containing protein n=1 Tax=Aquimarina pacifica TaxID=1296415 RepID=UPI00047276DE|nr:carboxypeptidase-like regulatory domain-containing protein [Aquimarina pacifica]
MKYIHGFCILFVFYLLIAPVYGQTVTSIVVDKNTNTPIPYSTIQVSQNQGVIANEEGRFSIHLNKISNGNDSIYISSMGYQKIALSIEKGIDSIIFIEPKTVELTSVFVSDENLTASEIIEKVKEQLDKNYTSNMTQKNLFFRQSDFTSIKKLNVDFKKSTIKELNKKFVDSVTRLIPKKSEYYIETLCDYYGNQEKNKIYITKAAELYDKNNLGSMDALSDRLEKIFTENVKPDSYLKIKSGIFGTKIQVDSILENNEEMSAAKDELASQKKDIKSQFSKYRRMTLNWLFKNLFFNDKSKLNMIRKSGRYLFEFVDYTEIDDQSVYIITFKPKNKEDFEGTLYINTQDFAIMRMDYKNIKPLRNFKLLGLTYKEHLYSGKMIFTKGSDNSYVLKYLKNNIGNTFGIDRPLKVIEKNKHVKGKRKQNELSLDIDAAIHSTSTYEVVIFDSRSLPENDYTNQKENTTIEPEYLSRYNPEFWKGYSIIEPNAAIREFTAASENEL